MSHSVLGAYFYRKWAILIKGGGGGIRAVSAIDSIGYIQLTMEYKISCSDCLISLFQLKLQHRSRLISHCK